MQVLTGGPDLSVKIPTSLRNLAPPSWSRSGPCDWGPRRSAAPGARETSALLLGDLKSKDSPCISFPGFSFVPCPGPKSSHRAGRVLAGKCPSARW